MKRAHALVADTGPETGERREGDIAGSDQTHRFSVDELEQLVRMTEERSINVSFEEVASPPAPAAPPSPPSTTPSQLASLTKRTPVLVMSEAMAAPRPQSDATNAPTAAAVSPSAPATKRITEVEATPRKPRAREARIVVDFEQNVLRRGYFTRRFAMIVLLVAIAVSRPWWFDIGDLRPRAGAVHR